jgi:hypothetical protein
MNTNMKQITRAEAIKLAKIHCNYETKLEFCLVDWVREHSRAIAEIETKRRNKTNFGTFPKGWKSAMKTEAANQAKAHVLAEFLEIHCMQFDGIIWLNNLEIINKLSRKK